MLHCPYCHGWEVRDQAIGVLGTGPMAVHQALLFRQLSDDVVLFTHTAPTPVDDEQAEQLAARGIRVVDRRGAGLEVARRPLTGVRLADGRDRRPAGAGRGAPVPASAGLLVALGLEPVEHPVRDGQVHRRPRAGRPAGRTAVPGVWVAGNVTDPMAQVIGAAAAGLRRPAP